MDTDLKILGGSPFFTHQLKETNYLPEWEQFEDMVDGIFDRKYYTNHGPLAQRFETELGDSLGVKHAICMTNTGIGLMIASKALDLKGKVVIPALSHISIIQAIRWAGLEPLLCDVNPDTFQMRLESIENAIDENVTAILGVNLFGGSCEYDKLEELSMKHSLKNFFVSSGSFRQKYNGKMIGSFGCCEVFSLHESNIVNTTDGCFIATNDDALAARLRNMRSSYGSGPKVKIRFTGNGRMSEIQAGIGLLTLKDFEKNVVQNKLVAEVYNRRLNKIKGIKVFIPNKKIENRNYQSFIIKISESEYGINAMELSKVLEEENIVAHDLSLYKAGITLGINHSSIPVAYGLYSALLGLPIRGVSVEDANKVCDVIESIYFHTSEVKLQLKD